MAKVKRERGTGGLIKIAGCRYYYAQFYKDGRQIRVSTKTDVKQEAQAVLRNLMTDQSRGTLVTSDIKKIHYGELRQALIQNYIERGNRSLQVLANGEETIWGLKDLDDFFGFKPAENGKPANPGMPVARITTDAARTFVQKRLREGVGNATINRSLASLRRMLRIAQEDGKIQMTPKIRMLKEPPARKGFLQRDQFDKLLVALPDRLKPLVTFLYFDGVRCGEALAIQWNQVNLQAGLIRLEDEQTKTGEARVVPLPDVLIKMLEAIEPKEGPVFDGTNLRKEWCRACNAVGLGKLDPKTFRYQGLILHDLRRAACSNLIKAGVPEKVAMTISGHKTRAVFDRYHIVHTEDVQNAMSLVESLGKSGQPNGENIVKNGHSRSDRQQLKP
jgi:integrase